MLWPMTYYIVAGVLFSVILSTCVSFCFFSLLRRRHADLLASVESQLQVITSGAHGMGQKILVLESKLSALECSQQEMKSSVLDFSYMTAEKLMGEGVDDRSIAANSGLSATEISLMRLLHNRKHTPYSTHV